MLATRPREFALDASMTLLAPTVIDAGISTMEALQTEHAEVRILAEFLITCCSQLAIIRTVKLQYLRSTNEVFEASYYTAILHGS